MTGYISPTDTNDTYPVIDPLYGIDGFRNVNLITDLNLIPEPRRRAGMVVGISGGTTYYKLNSSPWNYTISDWSLFNTGGGSSSGDYLPLSGGTVTGNTIFTLGLTGTTLDISGSTTSDLVKITQTGLGNAFVVEDITRPDSTPFVINTNGNIGIGSSSPGAKLDIRATGTSSSDVAFRVRNSGDTSDLISFRGDGSQWIQSVPFIHAGNLTGGVNNNQSLYLGYNSASLSSIGTSNVIIGTGGGSTANGNNNVSIGYNTSFGSFNSSIIIGSGAVVSNNNTCVMGSESVPFTSMLIGTGAFVQSAANVQNMNLIVPGVAGGFTSNTSASNKFFKLSAQNGSGNGEGAPIQFATAPSGTAGFTSNANVVFLEVRGDGMGLNHYQLPTPRIPSSGLTDGYVQYSSDIVSGNAAPHFRTEAGNIVKLYTHSAVTTSQGIANALTSLGLLSASTISSSNVSGEYLPLSGGTVSGATVFQNGLTANTISATTYQNLPTDIRVTGGTYSNGTTTFTNNTGGTFNVSGYYTGSTGTFGISNSGGTYTFYPTLSLAMSAATSGQTIEMFGDVIETSAVTITLKSGVNINGNGHSYTLNTSTTTTGFIDGGVSVIMLFSNITLVRKGSGAGIMIGLSVSGNRIVGNSAFIKIESNSSYGISNYGGAVFSGYINGFTVTCDGTSCTGIYLIRGYIDGCNVISTGNAIQTNIGTVTNSYGESTGAGNGITVSNTGYASNCNGKSNTGYGIINGVPVYNSVGYSSGSYGIYFQTGALYNCTGISAANYGIFGYGELVNNCTAMSSASGALLIQNAQANNCVAYSTVSVAVNLFNSSTVHNSTIRTLAGSTTVITSSTSTYASLKNCTIINDWNNSGGHCVPANSVLNVLSCVMKVANSSANCLYSSTPVSMKFANNVFEGSSTPINANVTQAITNTQDNYGNILI